jgi:hypothetical protein
MSKDAEILYIEINLVSPSCPATVLLKRDHSFEAFDPLPNCWKPTEYPFQSASGPGKKKRDLQHEQSRQKSR